MIDSGLLLPLILLIPLLLIFTSGRRRQKEVAATQARLAPGTDVITTAGLHARVVEVADTTVLLEVAPGVRTRWARGAVARVVSADGAAPSTGAGPAAGAVGTDGAGGVTGTASAPGEPEAPQR